MPGCATHKTIGTVTGLAYAAHRAQGQKTENFAVEAAGGALGGYVGGILPDILEPAISSWHRDTAHSVTVAVGVITTMRNALLAFEAYCRENAENCKAITMVPRNGTFVPASPVVQLVQKLAEFLWRFLAGFVNGLAAGYTSHLALDACTPRSIPLLTSRF